MFKAVGYRVTYEVGAFSVKHGSFTSYRLSRAIDSMRDHLMESNTYTYMMVLNKVARNSNELPDTLELMFIVPDSYERRQALMSAIQEFERIILSALGEPVNTEFRTIEPEDSKMSNKVKNTISDPPGEPDEFPYSIPD